MVLHQQIFSVFAGVANDVNSPAVVEQQSGNIAILSQSSSQWDDSAKTLLVDTLHTYTMCIHHINIITIFLFDIGKRLLPCLTKDLRVC